MDLAWWSGLTLRDARRALALAGSAITADVVGDRTFWVDPNEARDDVTDGQANPEAPIVRLLPNYDELLVAFRDRTYAADPMLPPSARVAEAILAHVLVRNGLVVGGWKRRDAGGSVSLELHPRVALDAKERAALVVEVERFRAFVGRTVEVTGLD